MNIKPTTILTFLGIISLAGFQGAQAQFITPTVHAVSSEHLPTKQIAKNTVNGSSLVNGKHILAKQRGITDVAGFEIGTWSTTPGDHSPSITYDLGSSHDVTSIHVWNYNSDQVASLTPEDQQKAERSTWHRTLSVFGPDKVEIVTSTDGEQYDSEGIFRFPQATSEDSYAGDKIDVDFKKVRFIRFDIKTTHEGTIYDGANTKIGPYVRIGVTGLSEVRFGAASILEFRTASGQELSLEEGGAVQKYGIRMRKKPENNETITVRAISEDPIVTLNGLEKGTFVDLRFDSNNWQKWQTVSVQAIDDDIHMTDYSGKIRHLVARGENPVFGRVSSKDLDFTLKENDPEVVDKLEPIKPEERMEWFNDIKYTWFIHWNPSSLTGYEISFARLYNQVPTAEYDQLYTKFNPTKFNAEEWVKLAKAAGLKTIVFVAKHCDGFCMWDTKTTDYNIMNTPFKRDVTKELAEACKKHGLRFSLYYSVMDWWQSEYVGANMAPGANAPKREGAQPDFGRFVKYMDAQVEELLTNYGTVSLMWWDGGYGLPGSAADPTPNEEWTKEKRLAFEQRARKLQPAMVQNNRVDLDLHRLDGIGDYTSTEFGLGGYDFGGTWEYTFTLGTQWSWKPNDIYKSKKYMIQMLMKVAGRGGCSLMDVSPDSTGAFEPEVVNRLTEIGNWLKLYGESYYGTRGGPYMVPEGSWGVSTRKGNNVYLHVLNWPADGTITIPPLTKKIVGSKLLTGGKLELTQENEGSPITIKVSSHDQKEINTIIELEIEGDSMAIPPLAAP